uniref:Uncharacterized protein n=1 Tax=Brassica oleracea var. oleracea TaxID=109376 RepID=A0A0D3ARU9_BRAOL
MGTSSAYTNLLNLSEMFNDKSTYRELSEIADQAKRRAEVKRASYIERSRGISSEAEGT